MDACDTKTVIDNQIALMNLVSALAQKLTGKAPIIHITLDDGSVVKGIPDNDSIVWGEGD